MKSLAKKIVAGSIIAVACTATFAISSYLWIVPNIISSNWCAKFVQTQVKKTLNVDLKLDGLKLTTGLNPKLGFSVNCIDIQKDNDILLDLDHLDTEISLANILQKRIIVNKILAENIFADASGLMNLFPQTEQKEAAQPDFDLDFLSSIIGVKKCLITYSDSNMGIKFDAKNIMLDRTQEKKYLHFDFDFEMAKGNDKIQISADDQHRIYMGNGELHIDSFPIEIDKSKIIVDAFGSRKQGLIIDISSKNFSAHDIYNMVTSNLVIPNGKELLAPICDVKGSVDFKVHLAKNLIRGNIDVNESEFKVVDLMKMPVKITQGNIEIGNKNIELKNFKGFYNNKKENSFTMSGDVKDYWKTCDTKIVSDIFVNNDFFTNYVSKMLGAPIELVGDAGSRLTLTSKNGSCDILWYFLLRENEGFKLGDQSMVLKDYKTLFKVDLSVVKNILKLNTIDYFITNELKKGMTPVLSINGNLDMADNMKLLNINLDIPRPLPSEFLNFLACQKIFKKGTIFGNLSIDNSGEFPTMGGVITFDKVFVPAQRLYIESAKIGAKGDKLGAIANGRFKRSEYDFKGYIVNDLRLPIVVKNVDLTVDNVDVEKMLALNTSQTAQNDTPLLEATNQDSTNDDVPTFTKGLIIVEKCALNLKEGKYKDVLFGNLHANLTLDKNGVLNIQSNKFDIAEGISTLKVQADLIKNNYYLRLGVKDVDSNIMATSILGLPREISGKAKGLIELNSDASLRLNGNIRFNIENGSIEKVGYVQYILNLASLFRNPLAMISPATLGDLVTIPDGTFDTINGELRLKDNAIELIKIKSSASHLSSFIIGRYELDLNDATLRIYTKMSSKGEGFAGMLRNISLNSLANKFSSGSKKDRDYYAAELEQIPVLQVGEEEAQVFLTKVDGDLINFNFLSSLKRIK